MALTFIGKDPGCDDDNCPALYDNGETIVVQGYRVTDPATLAQIGDLPDNETVLEIPKSLVPLFREVDVV